jgi:peptidoglycan/LPS O-acetylase OafA/YrhL
MKFKVSAVAFAIPAGLMVLAGILIWGVSEALIKAGVIALLYASVMGGVIGTVRVTEKLPAWAVRDVLRAALILGGSFLITAVFTGHLIVKFAPHGQAVFLILVMIASLGGFAGIAGGAYRVLRGRRPLDCP